MINQDFKIKITGILEPINSFKEKILLETMENEDRDISYIPPEIILSINEKLLFKGNYLSGTAGSSNKFDSWSLGICLLRICILCKSSSI